MASHFADDGLQQERTVLAWRRTGLALLVAAVVIGRLGMVELGASAVVLAAFAAGGAAWMAIASLRRGALATESSVDSNFSVLRDGRAPAALSAVICLLGAVELTTVLVG